MAEGRIVDSVKEEARQLASARAKRWPSRHEVKVSGGKTKNVVCYPRKSK